MPYLILAIGALIGLYTLYRFFLNADVREIKSAFLVMLFAMVGLALFILAITGRLPAALALLVAISPVVLGFWKNKKNAQSSAAPPKDTPLTREDALEILGLEGGASDIEIKAAYKKLMQKIHPDHEGSEWMAAKLNQARDFLLKEDK